MHTGCFITFKVNSFESSQTLRSDIFLQTFPSISLKNDPEQSCRYRPHKDLEYIQDSLEDH